MPNTITHKDIKGYCKAYATGEGLENFSEEDIREFCTDRIERKVGIYEYWGDWEVINVIKLYLYIINFKGE